MVNIRYDGEHAKTSKRLEEVVRNANDLTNGEMIIYLLDAITVLQKQEKAIQFMMDYGVEVEVLRKTMDCSIRDIIDMDKGKE